MFASLSPSFYLHHYDEIFLRHYYLSTVLYQEMAHAELQHCWCLFDIGLSLQFGEPMMHS
jgi:hypothetical protein